jgi:hypothetical protein
MCNCNSKSDPKSSKNDKAKQTITCKQKKFTTTVDVKFTDGSRKTISRPFASTSNSAPCTVPNINDYNNNMKEILKQFGSYQKEIAKKYKAAGKALPKIKSSSTSTSSSVGGTSCSGNKCNGYCCYSSESDCEKAQGEDTCYKCNGSSNCWVSIFQ